MAQEITWEDVKNTAVDIREDLDGFTQPEQDLIINLVNTQLTTAKYDSKTFDCRRFLAAHLAALALTPPAGEGTRAGESIGSVSTSVTLAVNNPTAKEGLLETQYGRQFWTWMQSRYTAFY